MSESTKGNLTFLAFVLGFGFGFWSLAYWVFNWSFGIAIIAAVAGGTIATFLLALLPFIIWGIVGD